MNIFRSIWVKFSDPDQPAEVLPGGSRPALPGTCARSRTRLHVSVHCQWHCNVHLWKVLFGAQVVCV